MNTFFGALISVFLLFWALLGFVLSHSPEQIKKSIAEWSSLPTPLTTALVALFIASAAVLVARVVNAAPDKDEPNIIFVAPEHSYTFTWDPPKSMSFVTRPSLKPNELEPKTGRLPAFRIKNIGKANAEDVKLEWKVRLPNSFSLESVVRNSARLQPYKVSIEDNFYALEIEYEPGRANGVKSILATEGSSSIQFLVPTLDNSTYELVSIPAPLWTFVELLTAATMSREEANPMSFLSGVKVELIVSISWLKPQPRRQNYLVTINILRGNSRNYAHIPSDFKINLNNEMQLPPEISAFVSFKIQELEKLL